MTSNNPAAQHRDKVVDRWNILAASPKAMAEILRITGRNGCAASVCADPMRGGCWCFEELKRLKEGNA